MILRKWGSKGCSAWAAVMVLTGLFCFGLFPAGSRVAAQTDDKVQQAIKEFEAGQDAHEKNDLPSAIAAYQRALALLPEFPEAQLQLGTAFLAQKDPAKAEAAFRRALELRPDWSLAMTDLGSVLVSLRKYEEARPLLKKALSFDPDNMLALTSLTELELKSNATPEVLTGLLADITRLTEKVRPKASLFSAKASVERALGKKQEAKASALKAFDLDGKDRFALSFLADAALAENDLTKADSYVKVLEAVAPGDEDTLVLRSRILVGEGKQAEAVALLSAIKDPADATRSFLGSLTAPETADLAGLEAIVQRRPNDPVALGKLCVGFRVKDPAKALDYCRRASIAEPNDISHAVNFAAALVQAREFDQAVALLRKLLTIAPNHATIRANLATALFQLKRYPEAKAEFRWLTENQPNSAIAFYFLGITFDRMGEYLDAMANYQKFLKLADPSANSLEIEKVNLRLPVLQRQIKDGKGKKS